MLTPFLDFAMSAGSVLGAAVILALLVVPCVIVWLVLKKPHAGRKVDINIMGKFVSVKVDDSNSALPAGDPTEPHGDAQTPRRDRPVGPAN